MSVFKVKSCDGETMEISLSIVNMSEILKNAVEGDLVNSQEDEMELQVSSYILKKIITWCRGHLQTTSRSLTFQHLENNETALYELIVAADYLNIKELLEEATELAASLLTRKSEKEIKETIGLKDDFGLLNHSSDNEKEKISLKYKKVFGQDFYDTGKTY